jgi:Lar family restriction alleviation protein
MSAAEAALKYCPFCGGEADYVGSEGTGYRVQCKACDARGPWGDYGYQARAAWNQRAPERNDHG